MADFPSLSIGVFSGNDTRYSWAIRSLENKVDRQVGVFHLATNSSSADTMVPTSLTVLLVNRLIA